MEQIITSDHRKHDNHLQVTLLFFPSLFLAWLPQQTRQKDFQCGSPKTEKRREFLEILGQGRRDHLRGSDREETRPPSYLNSSLTPKMQLG